MSAAVGPVSEALVDRIYECAFVSEHWPGVFDELAKIADARRVPGSQPKSKRSSDTEAAASRR
jgi:hypothetical protein